MTRCSYCQKEANKSELKRCSRCQYVLYCSKECQTLSWKSTHKYVCSRRDNNDAHDAREEKNLSSWLNAWTTSLCPTAVAALDLANHGLDYLVNHCLYIELKQTGDNTDAQRFKIDEIRVSHVDPLRNKFPELSSILTDPPELIGQRVRFLVAVKNHHGAIERVRTRVWNDGNIETHRNMSKENSQVLATAFMTALVGAIEAGDMGAIPSLMKARSTE